MNSPGDRPETPTDADRVQTRLVAERAPSQLLMVSALPDMPTWLRRYVHTHPDAQLDRLDPAGPCSGAAVPRYADLAIVTDALEHITRRRGEVLIASLRDVLSRYLLIQIRACTDTATKWPDQALIALGLRPVGTYSKRDCRVRLFHFNMFDYKTTPDWLSPSGWANPEMWDKARW